jgi:hypothetical protein
MMCNSQFRFSSCTWNDFENQFKHVRDNQLKVSVEDEDNLYVVAEEGVWNGDTVKFISTALQDTCKGLTGTTADFCGLVMRVEMTTRDGRDVSHMVDWFVKSTDNTTLASSQYVPNDAGRNVLGFGNNFWLPCGEFVLEVTDSSLEGKELENTKITLVDHAKYYEIHSFGDFPSGRFYQQGFILDQPTIEASRIGLCENCGGRPLPCKIPSNGIKTDKFTSFCEPFIPGTTDCPLGTVKCD